MNEMIIKPVLNELALDQVSDIIVAIEATANSIVVSDDNSYKTAADAIRQIRDTNKIVAEIIKPAKQEVDAVKKTLLDREKSILRPLDAIEATLKQKMSNYTTERENAVKREQERIAAERKAEAEALLQRATDAEMNDDVMGAMILRDEARRAGMGATVAVSTQKIDGVSTRKSWKANVVDESLVPIEVMGICIRPVDESALNKVAQMSKGKASIPGVEFFEESTIVVR